MLFLKLRERNSEKVIYDFYPGILANPTDEEYGTYSVDLATKEYKLIKDISKKPCSCYKGHAFGAIIEMIEKDELRDTLSVAWW